MQLETVADGVWATQTRVSFYGMPMQARTTIARLADGGLFVCSPGRIDDNLRRDIDGLGEVRAVVAPNLFHHLFVNDWRAAYPDASVHVPASLMKKRPDLADAEPLGDEAPEAYSEDIAQRRMSGLPTIDETWFYHRRSRTLIDTDLMHNPQTDPSWVARLAWRMMGSWQRFGPSHLERVLTRDRAALRTSIEAALEWPFERVVVAHGDVFEPRDARSGVRASWSWLLD